MSTTEIPVDNGVNVEALLGVRDALADTPQIAQFQWRSTVSWVNGTHSRSDVETFYGGQASRSIGQLMHRGPPRPRPSSLPGTVITSMPWSRR